jgi:phosphoserine phosphatase
MQVEFVSNLQKIIDEEENKALLISATGARVIIVTGCINALVSRVSETFIKNLHLIFL